MIYLGEHEAGFDANEIGFPSISGCRAIVIVTSGGLIGYHLAGELNDTKKGNFVNFVNTHQHGSPRRAFYVASAGAGIQAHHNQAREIAMALKYTGAIYWGACSAQGSVYVHYVGINNATCGITARPWVDATDGADQNKAPFVAGANRAFLWGRPNKMFINVDPTGLRAVYPKTLTLVIRL